MVGSDRIRHGLDNDVPVELLVAAHGRPNGVLDPTLS